MKKFLFLIVTVFLLLVSGCTTSDGGVTTPKIKFAKTFDGVLQVFNENMKCVYQEFKLYQDFNDINTNNLVATEDGRYMDKSGTVFYTFTDYFGFGEQNVITKIEYKKLGDEDEKIFSLFDTKVGEHVSKLYENMVAAGLMVYTEHNVNVRNITSVYDLMANPKVSYKYYRYNAGAFSIMAVVDSDKNTIENMSVSLSHCNYNVNEDGVKIYNYNDGMIYSNDMFLSFPCFDYDGKTGGVSYDYWFPKNDYKIFIYSKAGEPKPKDVYNSTPALIEEISILFVDDKGIQNVDPNISALYFGYFMPGYSGLKPAPCDAISILSSYVGDDCPNFVRVYFFKEDMIKEK